MSSGEELRLDVLGLQAYITVDRFRNGIAGGGLRFSPSVSLRELQRLALTMTHKWALLELPFGGCKLGIRGNPSTRDKTEILALFAREAKGFLQDRIFTGPDMGTSPADMRTVFSELGQDSYDVVNGRLEALGYAPTSKSEYRRILRTLQHDVTGVAVAQASKAAWEKFQGPFVGARVSIQGFGSVGKAAAIELDRLGALVVGIADAEACVWDPDGLDVEVLVGPRNGIVNRENLTGGAKEIQRDEWVGLEVDILMPAAVADAINSRNIDKVRAQMVVEAANIPVSHEAERRLHESGILVIPDFVVNGGLAAAFGALLTREWDNGDEVFEDVTRRIASSTSKVVQKALSEGRNPRDIAVEIAESRLGA